MKCEECGSERLYECDEDEGSLADGGTYVRYQCRDCGWRSRWVMLPD